MKRFTKTLMAVTLILGMTYPALAQNRRGPLRNRGPNSVRPRVDRVRTGQLRDQRQRGPTNRQYGKTFIDSFKVDGNNPGDQVRLRRSRGVAGKIRIMLNTPGTTWYKGIAVTDERNYEWKVERQDGNYVGQPVMEIPANRLGDTFQLVFWKAKFLGVSTYVHSQVFAKSDFEGRLTTVTWYEAGRSALPEEPVSGVGPVPQINQAYQLDGAALKITSRNGRPGHVRFEYSSTVNWWNMLQVLDIRETPLRVELEKSNAIGSSFIEVPTSQLDAEVGLQVWAAKFLGVHTHMATYTVHRKSIDGRIVTVNWKAK